MAKFNFKCYVYNSIRIVDNTYYVVHNNKYVSLQKNSILTFAIYFYSKIMSELITVTKKCMTYF